VVPASGVSRYKLLKVPVQDKPVADVQAAHASGVQVRVS